MAHEVMFENENGAILVEWPWLRVAICPDGREPYHADSLVLGGKGAHDILELVDECMECGMECDAVSTCAGKRLCDLIDEVAFRDFA